MKKISRLLCVLLAAYSIWGCTLIDNSWEVCYIDAVEEYIAWDEVAVTIDTDDHEGVKWSYLFTDSKDPLREFGKSVASLPKYSGSRTIHFEDLKPSTEYHFVCAGISPENTILGNVRDICIYTESIPQRNIIINPSKVLKPYIPYQDNDLNMLETQTGTTKLRITALIYDSKGNLYEKRESLVSDYNSAFTFQVQLEPDEEYKMLAFSSAVLGTQNNLSWESYSFNDISNLNTLEIRQNEYDSYYSNSSILGVYDGVLTGNGDITAELTSATALVYLNYRDIHALHNLSSDSIYGRYAATATDEWYGITYSWEMSIIAGENENEVIINNLSPALCNADLTSFKGVNCYRGYISGNKLIIPKNQDTGCSTAEEPSEEIFLSGLNSETSEREDIIISIDKNSGNLTLENWWVLHTGSLQVIEIFSGGVEFVPQAGSYYQTAAISFRNNDIVRYNNGFTYTTSLSNGASRWYYISPYYESSDNIYVVANFLPGSFEAAGKTFWGKGSKEYDKHIITMTSGKQYILAFDYGKMELDFTTGQLKSSMWSLEHYDIDDSHPFAISAPTQRPEFSLSPNIIK